MLKALIIDDQPKVANALRKLIENNLFEIEIIDVIHDFQKGIEACNKLDFDLLFLDVELGEEHETGFNLLKKLAHNNFHLIITTSYSKYAIQAIRLSAIDFLLKPVDVDELKEAVKKVVETNFKQDQLKIQLENVYHSIKENISPKKLILKFHDSIHAIEIKDIIRCEADVNYTNFYLVNGGKKTISKPLKEYDEILGGIGFFRSHKSHLVNLKHFMSYEKRDGGMIVMSDKSEVPVSNRKKEVLFSVLENI